MVQEMGWREAILKILEDSSEPLHYKEISRRVIDSGLRPVTGSTPENSASRTITQFLLPEGRVERIEPGVFWVSRTRKNPSKDELKEAQEEDRLTNVAAYGLYWDRDKVLWNPGGGGKRQLLGIHDGRNEPVDLANQSGIYVLFNRLTPMYVGRTDKKNLFGRLEDHNDSDRRRARWDQFSWFGFREISENGTLSNENVDFSTSILITVLESVMIEAFIPPLNDRGGELLGTMYSQVEDPVLVNKREAEFLDTLALRQPREFPEDRTGWREFPEDRCKY